MAVKNSTILAKAWLEGSNDFQQRIPNPEIADYANVVSELFAPYNNDLFNQFSGLLNGLMGTFIESKTFYNPLKNLKKPAARFGNSARHVAVAYMHAHSYKADDETLLKLEKPEYREWFYSVTAPRRYEFSWSRYELSRVFASDGYGFDDLLAATISQMISSDEYDEMNLMIQAFAEADSRMDGLFRHQITGNINTEAGGKELLAAIRTYAGRMKFPTMLYNHIDIPVYENGDTLILWVTPEVRATLDVNTLASVFNLDKADIQYRIITIPEFPLPNVYAALTSEDFIYCRDVQYGIEPPFYNPANMTYKYYLHHAQMIGVNPVANCVLFGTDADTSVPTITLTPSSLDISAVVNYGDESITGVVSSGVLDASIPIDIGSENVKFIPNLVGTISDTNAMGAAAISIEPDAVMWEISAEDADGNPKPLNSRTYIDANGYLHVQKTGLVPGDLNTDGDTLVFKATSTYINPSGATAAFTNEFTAKVTKAPALGAKNCSVERYPNISYAPSEDPTDA